MSAHVPNLLLFAHRDDYFILLLDSGGGLMYSLSQRFAISSTASPATKPLASPVATVTVSGAPNPTMQFAATYAASGASKLQSSKLTSIAIAGIVCVLGSICLAA